MPRTLSCPYFRKAVLWCIPIGGLGGLIGLGGGEFRLPVLMQAIGFEAKAAIPLNLLVSLITLAFAMIVRSQSIAVVQIVPYLPEVVGLALGGAASAFYGAGLVRSISSKRLVLVIAILLAVLGALLMTEAASPFQRLDLLPESPAVRLGAGAGIGLAIGLVSSMLGVAGGELLIPTLIFLFGADIKTAGSASILISLGVVAMGLWRYWRLDAIPRSRGAQRMTLAMSAGSILGALIGGLAVAYAPIGFLKLLLGMVLIAAALKTMFANR
ncbi:MAG: sulfite exporter TauE/SafE family protein [Proteobacteria bacterium]|nr:sulfite exporter TauE/SafE family protein [Pseudomonadota bacterium]MBI3499203.1 sulfite exporter TauE/SafE family protein [Pseudomonadota bacterium]